MKKNLRLLAGAAVGAVASLSLTSCYYDPNYSSATVGGSYSSGYGQGHGYGGSGFSTSLFVGTGNSQWGYDPHCYSYYDYHRRAYYDPYLNGYYPVGYRPPVVYGVPHPYGWHSGVAYIRPPVYVSNVTVRNYQNRASLYQNSSYGWARQVRQQPASQGRVVGSHPSQSNSGNSRVTGTHSSSSSSSNYSSHKNTSASQSTRQQSTRQSTNTGTRPQKGTLPSSYNKPVKVSDEPSRQAKVKGSHPQSKKEKNSNKLDLNDPRNYR